MDRVDRNLARVMLALLGGGGLAIAGIPMVIAVLLLFGYTPAQLDVAPEAETATFWISLVQFLVGVGFMVYGGFIARELRRETARRAGELTALTSRG